MAEVTLKNGQAVPKKPKKRMPGWAKFLIIFFSIIIGLPLLLVGIFYACFYNGSFKGPQGRDGIENAQVFEEAMVDSLDYTKGEKKIRVRVTEQMLNQVLYNASKSIREGEAGEYVDNIYVEVDEDSYNFVLQAKYKSLFKTKAIIFTKLEIGEENIVFKIDNVKVGNIGGMKGLFKLILNKAGVTSESLTKTLQESGLSMTADLDKLEIVYPIEDFKHDVTNKFVPENNDEYAAILSETLNITDFYKILPNSPLSTTDNTRALELAINIENMKANSETFGIDGFTMKDGYFNEIAEHAKEKVVGYLNANYITKEDAATVFKYHVVGYDYLSANEKGIVDSYLTYDLIDSDEGHYDYSVPENESLEYICRSQIQSQAGDIKNITDLHNKAVAVSVDTDQVDKMLGSSNVLGTPYVFTRKTDNGYKLNYVVISRVSTVVSTDENGNQILYFVISVNMNGYEIHLSLATESITTTDFAKMQFKVSDMYLGTHKVSPKTKEVFMKMVTDSIDHAAFDGAIVLETIDNELYITMSIEDIYKDNSAGWVREEFFNISYNLVANTSSKAGKLVFVATSKF